MSKLTKRGFLKAVGLAPAAAVAAKATLSEQLSKFGAINAGFQEAAIPAAGYANKAPGYPMAGASDWLQRELKELSAELLKLQQSEPEPAAVPQLFLETTAIDALRSVSPAIKLQIARREVGRRGAARHQSYIERRIADVKKELGPLGVLFDV